MRVLADNCVPTDLIQALREAGHIVVRVVDLADQALPDRDVARLAVRENAVLLTCDNDFKHRRAFPHRMYGGVILVHDYARDPARVAKRLVRLTARQQGALAGCLVVADPRSVRIKR